MTTDFMTVLWKEWKEILLQRSAGGSGARQPLVIVLIVGILLPLRMGPQRFFSPEPLLILTFLAAVATSAVVADAFAGERERHTLETLLASRLPDSSILLGKIAACTAYGWLITMACVVLGTVTVNIANWHGQILMFHDAPSWLGLILGPPVLGAAVASAGVFVSLHAARCARLSRRSAWRWSSSCLARFLGSTPSRYPGKRGLPRFFSAGR